jgi:hypothetical protein
MWVSRPVLLDGAMHECTAWEPGSRGVRAAWYVNESRQGRDSSMSCVASLGAARRAWQRCAASLGVAEMQEGLEAAQREDYDITQREDDPGEDRPAQLPGMTHHTTPRGGKGGTSGRRSKRIRTCCTSTVRMPMTWVEGGGRNEHRQSSGGLKMPFLSALAVPLGRVSGRKPCPSIWPTRG